jgi:hypothetical protein
MSRSRRKTPAGGAFSQLSEKAGKRLANRILRRKLRTLDIRSSQLLPLLREVSDAWSMVKEGRRYWGHGAEPRLMRK